MNENLNLLEILKDAPKGTKLYSTIWGEMEFISVESFWIKCLSSKGVEWSFEPNGKLSASSTEDGECVIFPSKEQRDWSKFNLDLPIDTPVMVKTADLYSDWVIRYYNTKNTTFCAGKKQIDNADSTKWRYIVPVKDFDFENLESNKERSIC
jgi:hypothetical protein